MLFHETRLKDARLIELQMRGDSRGGFARTFCAQEFEAQGLVATFVQQNMSRSTERGALRGLHLQRAPHEEVKVMRCTRGAIFDVIVDLRPESPTYRKWEGFELTQDNGLQLYVPQGFAHGYQTLADDTEVSYLVSAYYAPDAEAGVRHDDPAFGIVWPMAVTVMSDKDKAWPDFEA